MIRSRGKGEGSREEDKILLTHGSGGKLMHELIDDLFMRRLKNPILDEKKDSAVVALGGKKMAFTTDSYVVNPIFFPGGDIGSLAVYGTVNDLAVCGAKPLYLSLAIIIEEGLGRPILERIVCSIEKAAKRAGVTIVTGDTKVVEKGSCDKIFITTSGVGEVYYRTLSVDTIETGDSIIINGPIGEHAVSVLSKREGISFTSNIKSDSAPLYGLIDKVLKVSRNVHFMRDPTRGGVATTLNEIVMNMAFGISLDESAVPVSEGVKNACELLGFDPLYLACEGRVIVVVAEKDEKKVLAAMKRDPLGRRAKKIGKIVSTHRGKVSIMTAAGGKRIVGMLSGEQLPRIC